MNGVFIIPTGIGCEIGGHAGDANPAVKLIASVCDNLIVNPNAVNASDINEMPENCLYVEGSSIDRFLNDEIILRPVKNNKILVVTNDPIKNDVVNSVNAARTTIGTNIDIARLRTPLTMIATKNPDGSACGTVMGWKELCEQVREYSFDALAITTQIDCSKHIAIEYMNNGGVNPWGAVEARASRLISQELNKPVAHSPQESDWIKEERYEPPITDPRLSAEMVSVSYLHCILKGLWKAPRLVKNDYRIGDTTSSRIDFMISPYGCWGRPHKACIDRNIPIIVVKENNTILNERLGKCILVENYLEAVGVVKAMDIGISLESVERPIKDLIL